MGRDAVIGQGQAPIFVSIHAPAWGATVDKVDRATRDLVSIHAPAWGATDCVLPWTRQAGSFNPRARMGRDDGMDNDGTAIAARFNPRARMGRDSTCAAVLSFISSF